MHTPHSHDTLQSKQYAKLSDCYYRLGDWNALSRLVSVVPVGMTSEKDPALLLLLDLAQKLEAVGVHQVMYMIHVLEVRIEE